jgi:hypothetical protein
MNEERSKKKKAGAGGQVRTRSKQGTRYELLLD